MELDLAGRVAAEIALVNGPSAEEKSRRKVGKRLPPEALRTRDGEVEIVTDKGLVR